MNEVDIFVSNYLEHYGVKGMKWGVRRGRALRRSAKLKKYGPKDKSKRTPSQIANRQQRAVDRGVTAVSVGVGALYVASIIQALNTPGVRSGYSYSQGTKTNFKTPSKSVKDVINANRKLKVDSIDRTFREGFIDKAQRDKFIDAMNKRYDKKIVDALTKK